jgi:hypothetical protein
VQRDISVADKSRLSEAMLEAPRLVARPTRPPVYPRAAFICWFGPASRHFTRSRSAGHRIEATDIGNRRTNTGGAGSISPLADIRARGSGSAELCRQRR